MLHIFAPNLRLTTVATPPESAPSPVPPAPLRTLDFDSPNRISLLSRCSWVPQCAHVRPYVARCNLDCRGALCVLCSVVLCCSCTVGQSIWLANFVINNAKVAAICLSALNFIVIKLSIIYAACGMRHATCGMQHEASLSHCSIIVLTANGAGLLMRHVCRGSLRLPAIDLIDCQLK